MEGSSQQTHHCRSNGTVRCAAPPTDPSLPFERDCAVCCSANRHITAVRTGLCGVLTRNAGVHSGDKSRVPACLPVPHALCTHSHVFVCVSSTMEVIRWCYLVAVSGTGSPVLQCLQRSIWNMERGTCLYMSADPCLSPVGH
jgi:hypothetical protein